MPTSKTSSRCCSSFPGVTADLSSGDEIKIKLRGIENQRYMGEKPGVAIVIDGVPVFERTGKVNIDLDNIESIKVIKGGASYLFGDDGLVRRSDHYHQARRKVCRLHTGRGSRLVRLQQANRPRRVCRARRGSGHVQVSQPPVDDYYFQSAYKTEYLDGNMQLLSLTTPAI